MASKKPEPLRIGGLEFAFEPETGRVWVSGIAQLSVAQSFHRSHLADLDYWATAVRDYEPEPWEPRPGQLFRREGSLAVYRRVAGLGCGSSAPYQLVHAMGGNTLDTPSYFAAVDMAAGRICWFRFWGSYVPVDVESKGDDDE